MLPRLSRPSHATVVAYVALFVALGGTSFAAVAVLQKGSVKAKHIARNAVTAKKVKDRSLLATDFKQGQLPQGASGAEGPRGATGPAGAAGTPGDIGPQGPGAVKIAWTKTDFEYNHQLATVGPWTIKADCDMQGGASVYLDVLGPGTVDYNVIRADGTTALARANGFTLPRRIDDFSGQAVSSDYLRSSGTLILHSGATVATVDLHILADERPAFPNPGICSVHGTAVPAA